MCKYLLDYLVVYVYGDVLCGFLLDVLSRGYIQEIQHSEGWLLGQCELCMGSFSYC